MQLLHLTYVEQGETLRPTHSSCVVNILLTFFFFSNH